MTRIARAFANKAKVAYLTAGDGTLSAEYFLALARGGTNVLEIGIPFSDPVADGSVIQLAMERALKNNTNLDKVFDLVAIIRPQTDAALILFTYFNPIQKDCSSFLAKAAKAGVDGILVVDLPYEEGADFRFLCEKFNIASIQVVAPSTSLARIRLLSAAGSGFLYYACRKGTTGLRDELPKDINLSIQKVKRHSKLPVAVGFGISNKEMVKKVLSVADGSVIGSYFVNAVAQNIEPAKLEQMARDVFDVN